MKTVSWTLAVQLSVVLFAATALAQGAPKEPSAAATPAASGEAADELHMLAITISPIHLAFPLVELTGEYRLNPKMGAALIGGFGSISDASNTYSLWEVGAQFRYYALGDFDHGMQLGAELVHLGISTSSSDSGVDMSASGAGTTVGGFVGYKVAASFGLTFDMQLGYQYIMVAAEAEAQAGEISATAEKEESEGGVLLNLNLGWSF